MSSPTIHIRAAEPTDAADISALIGSDGVVEGTLQMPLAPVASRLERYAKPPPGLAQIVATVQEQGLGKIVGYASLFELHSSARRAHARGLAIAVALDWQGRGVGQSLMQSLVCWADDWAGLLRIELTVFADNAKAIALYKRHGFVEEGLLRAYALRAGEYVDALAMARLHPRPPQLKL
jgi:L-phenylalanine/L-methionine N-acetyltransferase